MTADAAQHSHGFQPKSFTRANIYLRITYNQSPLAEKSTLTDKALFGLQAVSNEGIGGEYSRKKWAQLKSFQLCFQMAGAAPEGNQDESVTLLQPFQLLPRPWNDGIVL
jgi:hypothetical protein